MLKKQLNDATEGNEAWILLKRVDFCGFKAMKELMKRNEELDGLEERPT